MNAPSSRTLCVQALWALAVLTGCASASHPAAPKESQMTPIYEVAVQQIHADAEADYPAARAAFLAELQKQPGNLKDWTFESFFTMPEPNTGRVLVGVTRWASMAHFAQASEKLSNTPTAGAVFSKVDMKAFVQARPLDPQFELERYIDGPDRVLEVAVRKPKAGVSEAEYTAARDAFFSEVRLQPGFLFDQELVDDQGHRVVLIGWDSTQRFQAALGVLPTKPEMGAFFSKIDVLAYQAAHLK